VAVAYESDGGTVWAAANNNNAVTVPLPATRPNGSVLLLVAWCRLISAAAPAPSDGYTLLGTFTSATASGGRIWVYARVADGTEVAPSLTPAGTTGTSGDVWGACLYCYSGVELAGGISAILDGTPTTTDASGTTTCTYPALTITGSDSMLVRLLARFRDAADTFTPTATWNEREDASTTNRTGGQHHLQDKNATASGAQASVTVAPSNTTAARYLAVTLALKAALGVTRTLDATLVGDATVTANEIVRERNVAATVVGDGAVAVDAVSLPPPITFDAAITTNQPYAGVYDCGEFTCGVGSILALDLAIERFDFIEGGISGQAQVAASLTRTRDLLVPVVGAGAVSAQSLIARGLPAAVAGVGAVAADTEVVGGETIEFGIAVAGTGAVASQQAVTRTMGATLVGVAGITAQQALTRGIAATVAGAGVVAPAFSRLYSLSSSVVGTGAISAQTVGTLALGTTVIGSSSVVPSLTVTNASFINLDIFISGQGSLTAQAVSQRSLATAISGVGSLTAQQAPLRGYAVSIAGQAAVAAQADRTVSFGCTVARAASVAVQLAPSTPLAASISRQAAVTVAVGKTVSLGCSVSGAAVVTPGLTVTGISYVNLDAAISGVGQISTDIGTTAANLVTFACEIKVIPHLCGEYLAGQQLVGGTGPRAIIYMQTVTSMVLGASIQGNAVIAPLLRPSTSLASAITGKAYIDTLLRPSTSLNAVVAGQANVAPYPTLNKLVLGAAVVGKATITVKIGFGWLVPTEPGNVILAPTDEADWTLIPTTPGDVTLVPTTPGSVILTPTDDEDLLLVPTTERTM